jgi:hypothetical protein
LNEISPKNRNQLGVDVTGNIPAKLCEVMNSSISVWRVTCYDHFCVFQFFRILAVSMATAAILKKSTLNSTTSHGI